jgi:catechol 2,3-dioxygenase-like lactoylglutathione lyase family enzyme
VARRRQRRQIHLIEATSRRPRSARGVPGRRRRRTVAQLRAAGVDVSDAKPVGDTTIRQAFAHDPDGNLIELSQPA